MIYLIHGEDNYTSRKYFMDQKDNESITFDAETLNLDDLKQSLMGSGLFEESKKIFIENLFTRKGNKVLSDVSKILSETKDSEVYLWASKDVGVRSLKEFPKFENKNFKIPQNIWSFLDSIKPNSKQNVVNFHLALKGTDVEIIFAMIIRQFRLMLALNSDIDEAKKLAPWQSSKLTKQALSFGEDKLKNAYKKLYLIDKKTKTGKTNLSLTQNIDIFLLQI